MRRLLTIPVTWFLLVGNLQAVEPVVPSSSGAPAVQSRRAGAWLVQETANFRVWSPIAWKDAAKLPTACEALRRHLRETWLDGVGDDWSPKCEVVIHSTVAEYVRALGPGSEQSSGCATIEIEPGRGPHIGGGAARRHRLADVNHQEPGGAELQRSSPNHKGLGHGGPMAAMLEGNRFRRTAQAPLLALPSTRKRPRLRPIAEGSPILNFKRGASWRA